MGFFSRIKKPIFFLIFSFIFSIGSGVILPGLAGADSNSIDTHETSLDRARQTFQLMSSSENFRESKQFENCMTVLINNDSQTRVLGAHSVSLKLNHLPSGIRPAFSSIDVHGAQAAFSTVNGFNFSRIFHDSGLWPALPGSTNTDDGIPDGFNIPGNGEDGFPIDEAAGEIYDVDGNQHYPGAVLRAIGSRCYIFLPVYLFPTLPRGLDPFEGPTTPAPALSRLFWVDSPAAIGTTLFWSPATATGSSLLEPRFLFGFDKNSATSRMQQVANEFDSLIYPRISDAFGNPPDIDQDPRIFLLVDDIRDGSGNFRGYFNSVDQQPTSVDGFSNAKEILFIDAFPSLSLLFNSTLGTVAHELVHLIVFNENGKKSEERWIDEGMADLGRNLYDGSETTNVDAFIRSPDTSLVSNEDSEFFGPNTFAHRGNGYLFSLYLIEKYGKGNPNSFIRKVVGDDALGVVGINNALKDQNITFEDVFKTWTIANHLNKTRRIDGTLLNNGLWGYNYDNDNDATNNIGTNESLPVKLSEAKTVAAKSPILISAQVNDTAADYIQLTGVPGDLTVNFDGMDTKSWAFGIIKKSDSIDTDVVWPFLDSSTKNAQVDVKNFGTGNTYKELVFVPVNLNVSGGSVSGISGGPTTPSTISNSGQGDSPGFSILSKISAAIGDNGHYVISAGFNNISVAVWPNPVHENELLIALNSKTGFGQTPSAVITYGGVQRQLILSAIGEGVYLSRFTILDSGEGTVVATGQDPAGLLLKSTLQFSASHINDRISPIPTRSSLLANLQKSLPSLLKYYPEKKLATLQHPSESLVGSEMVEMTLNGHPLNTINLGTNQFKGVLEGKLKSGENVLRGRVLLEKNWSDWEGLSFTNQNSIQCELVEFPGFNPQSKGFFKVLLTGGDPLVPPLIELSDFNGKILKKGVMSPMDGGFFTHDPQKGMQEKLTPGLYRFKIVADSGRVEKNGSFLMEN